MAGNHTLTSNFNKEILINKFGLKQLLNTTIFKKKGFFVLSPSVQNVSNWFDLRKVNLEKFNRNIEKGFLLIRFRDKFLLTSLDNFIKDMISEEKFSDTKNSGIHWQFLIRPDDENTFTIINRHDKNEVSLQQISTEDLKSIFIIN